MTLTSVLLSALVDGDAVDRLARLYSSLLLLSLSLVTSLIPYLITPLRCACPDQFSTAMCSYSTALCWNQNNFYVPSTSTVNEEQTQVQSLPWVSGMLLLHAVLLYVPGLPWTLLSQWTQVKVTSLLKVARRSAESRHHEEKVKAMTLIARSINSQRGRTGAVVLGFLFTKFLSLITLIIQLCLLDTTPNHKFLGYSFLFDLFRSSPVSSSNLLPSEVLCDLKLRKLGNVQRYTLACAPGLSDLYGRILALLWLWLLILLFMVLINIVFWLMKFCDVSGKVVYTRRMLEYSSEGGGGGVAPFYHRAVGTEGFLILHLIASNIGEIEASSVVNEMWRIHTTSNGVPQGGDLGSVYPTGAVIPQNYQTGREPMTWGVRRGLQVSDSKKDQLDRDRPPLYPNV